MSNSPYSELPPDVPAYSVSTTRRRGLPPWAIVAIVVGALTLVGIIGAGVFTLAFLFSSNFASNPSQQSLLPGEPADPMAIDPLACADECWTSDSADSFLASASLRAGLDLVDDFYPPGTFDPSTAGELYRSAIAGWRGSDGTPDDCFFAPASAPVNATVDPGQAEDSDPVVFLATVEDPMRTSTLDQSARFFPDSDSAEMYLTELAGSISTCSILTIGNGRDQYTAQIDAQPAIPLPDVVAGAGWIRTGDPGLRWRAYIVDLQHGNVVVRTRLLTDGTITQSQFLDLVTSYAEQLAALEPQER